MKINTYYNLKNLCGRRVREARLKNNMSQQQLAAKLQVEGVSIERDSLSRIETGNRFVSDFELKVLAKILKVSVDWLLDAE